VGRLAHGLPPPRGRRSVAADVPARLAQGLQRRRPDEPEQRRLCGRRATKRSDWRGGRAAASTSMQLVFSGPAPGLAGARGGVRDARAPSGAQRSDLRVRPDRQAGVGHAQHDGRSSPRSPGTGKGRRVSRPASPARPDSREGRQPVKGRDAGTPVARREAQRPGPAQRGHAQAHRDLNADAAAPARSNPASGPTSPSKESPSVGMANAGPKADGARYVSSKCQSETLPEASCER
jgi:hypothetical protein